MSAYALEDLAALHALDADRPVSVHEEQPPDRTKPIAVRLHDLVVHDNRKWASVLGGADVRVDVLAVTGNALDGDDTKAYVPSTHRFHDVGDGDTLPMDDSGLLAFFGWPRHFIDLSVIVSRDRRDSDDLATLLRDSVTSDEFVGATETIANLIASPTVFALREAIGAAATLGSLAYTLVQKVSQASIGLYRGNRLESQQRFGIGRNPDEGTYRVNELSLWYEVIEVVEG